MKIKNEKELLEGLSCNELEVMQEKVSDKDSVINEKNKKNCPL